MSADPYDVSSSAPLLGSAPVGPPSATSPLSPAYSPVGIELSTGQAPMAALDMSAAKSAPVMPPSFEPAAPLLDNKIRTSGTGEQFTVADALAAMERHAESKCCLKSGISNELNVLEMRVMSAVHVIFESSTEMRSTVTASVSYTPGSHVDGPQYGAAPMPWDIVAAPTTLFQDEHRSLEVPHTSSVVDCDRCHRRGSVACESCTGVGTTVCGNCHGSGTTVVHHHHHSSHHNSSHSSSHHSSHGHHHHHDTRQPCHRCGGRGRATCLRCSGSGFVTCSVCSGTGLLRCYIRLDIDWKLYKSERVLDQSCLAPNLIRGAGGTMMFQEEDYVIRPISHLPQAEVNQACNELVAGQKIPHTERLLRQRVHVRCIPIYEVHYTHKGADRRRFWVFGTDRQVFEENYPGCCACSIQ